MSKTFFITNDKIFDTLKDAIDAVKPGEIIFCTGDIFDYRGSIPDKSLDDTKDMPPHKDAG